MTVLDSTFCNS